MSSFLFVVLPQLNCKALIFELLTLSLSSNNIGGQGHSHLCSMALVAIEYCLFLVTFICAVL